MGLDMNLYREVQLKDKMKITDEKINEVLEAEMRPSVRHSVCYWRKFNALHKYFDDHFNEGDNDNCVDMYMEIEDIEELLNKVKKIRRRIRLGDGFISSYSSSESKDKLKGHKVGDEVLSEIKKLRSIEDNITSAIIESESGDFFHIDYRTDGKVVLKPEVCGELETTDGFFYVVTEYD